MRRRDFIQGVAALGALATGLPALRAAKAQGPVTVRFVPSGDIANFDPIWGTSYSVRNAALLVWDTLYGIDENLVPQKQMVGSEHVSADGLIWTFTLRPGLRFHDGAPVRAQDVVASLKRWAARDSLGQMITAIQVSLDAVDDNSFRWQLKQPFPKLLFALGKANAPCAFIMPERIAATDPFKMITEFVGSGPMRFVAAERVVGSKAVFEKFQDYVPREEPASWMAGGKRVSISRLEWVVMPDPSTAASALQNGEVDWIERPLNDLVPLLEKSRNVKTGISNLHGNVSGIRFNHLQPPFDNPKVRRAVLMALDQKEFMESIFGDQTAMWKPMNSFFTPGTPLYDETGGDILKGPRNLATARDLVAASGYKGEPIVVMVAQDNPTDKGVGEVTATLLRKLGMTVDLVTTDFGTIQQRRQSKKPAAEGGWHIFFVSHAGTDCVNPAAYIGLRARGEKSWFGWPASEAVEAGIANWYVATTPELEKKAAAEINMAAFADVVFAPTGFFLAKQAWHARLNGVVPAPFPVFWGVTRTA
jgi:peptide/nickel transport system substrate-binding protein